MCKIHWTGWPYSIMTCSDEHDSEHDICGSEGGEYTYSLTPWCRVLLEKLTGLQLVKKFPAFYGTRRFITALTSVRHLSLSWASPIQSIYTTPTSWRSILRRWVYIYEVLSCGLGETYHILEGTGFCFGMWSSAIQWLTDVSDVSAKRWKH